MSIGKNALHKFSEFSKNNGITFLKEKESETIELLEVFIEENEVKIFLAENKLINPSSDDIIVLFGKAIADGIITPRVSAEQFDEWLKANIKTGRS